MSWNEISERWCRTMHSRTMWPIHGRYVCPECGRKYPVVWEATPPAVEYAVSNEPFPARKQQNAMDDWARKMDDLARRLTWSAKLLLERAASPKRSDTM